LERRYLAIFMVILVASLVIGLVWNAILDFRNRGEAVHTLRKCFDTVRENNSKVFVDMSMIAQSMIYSDYDQDDLWKRVSGLTRFYKTFADMSELKSVGIVKALERTGCLVKAVFTDMEGAEQTRYVVLVKYQNRAEVETWVPHSVLTIRDSRVKVLAELRERANRDVVRREAEKLARGVLAAPAEAPGGRIAEVLSGLDITQEQRQGIANTLETTAGQIPAENLVAFVRSTLSEPFRVTPRNETPKAYYEWLISELKSVGEEKRQEPELDEPAQAIADILLDRNRLMPEKLENLTKLGRASLQNPGARTVFAAECELAEVLGGDLEKLVADYGELASLPAEMKVQMGEMVSGLVSTGDTLDCWKEILKMDQASKRRGTLIAFKRLSEMKSLEEQVALSLSSEDEKV
jgi:hypothetical protein